MGIDAFRIEIDVISVIVYLEDALIGANQSLAEALQTAGAEVIWHPAPGRHDFAFCNDQLPNIMQWLGSTAVPKEG